MSKKAKHDADAGDVPAAKVARVATVSYEPPERFTEEQQNAYAVANLNAAAEDRKQDADIHAWYRRTGGKAGA